MKENQITGKTLIDWGHEPGPWFGEAIKAANESIEMGQTMETVRRLVEEFVPVPIKTLPLRDAGRFDFKINIQGENEDEQKNIDAVIATMSDLMRTPVVEDAAIMPDACPAGPLGTIPVGGVVKSKHIHPGMHSADICCSMAVTLCGKADPIKLLDAAQKITHFGGGGRPRGQQIHPSSNLLAAIENNPFMGQPVVSAAIEHHATQGDGNHFLYVGRLRSTGETALVTHHGSRKPGAMLYKAGMKAAERHCRDVSPETRKQNAWIDMESVEGFRYWEALQLIRQWTKSNHFTLHDMALAEAGANRVDRMWNEHNFVFLRDGFYYHAKGATPGWKDFAPDSQGLTLVPLNMAEPILITRGMDAPNGLGFLPHGAGRNFSRSEHIRRNAHLTPQQMVDEETKEIDARFWSGIPDASEMPSAYKNAEQVTSQIKKHGLAWVVDHIDPVGCIMAGDWMKPHRDRRRHAKKTGNQDIKERGT